MQTYNNIVVCPIGSLSKAVLKKIRMCVFPTNEDLADILDMMECLQATVNIILLAWSEHKLMGIGIAAKQKYGQAAEATLQLTSFVEQVVVL